MTPNDTAALLVAEARRLGFHRIGIVPIEPARRHDVYREWLKAGHAGEMAYLAEQSEERRDPRALLPEARTVVVVALAYGIGMVPAHRLQAAIARYARGTDYHIVIRDKLHDLAKALPASLAARICVDTAPILERDLAEAAGIGFVAKNTMLIAPGLGSYVLLGELLLGVDVAPVVSEAPRKRCGECRSCLDACPTGAFIGEYTLDARRCISYLTIELQGSIPLDLRPLIGARIFGCDVCQEVCPFNAGAGATTSAPEFADRLGAPDLIQLLDLGAAQFRKFVRRTALRRVRRQQLLRNVCVALGNTGDAAAIPHLRRALEDRHSLVRAHAAWALGRLGDLESLRARLALEDNEEVRREIELALSASRS